MNQPNGFAEHAKRYLHRRVHTENYEDFGGQAPREQNKQHKSFYYPEHNSIKTQARNLFGEKSHQVQNAQLKTQYIHSRHYPAVSTCVVASNGENQKPYYAYQDKQSSYTLKHINIQTAVEEEEEIPPVSYKHLKNPQISKSKPVAKSRLVVKNRPDKNSTITEGLKPAPIDNMRGQYQIQGIAGKGTFGVVYHGQNSTNGERIAIKKVLQDKKYKNRELQILKQITHINLLSMKEHYFTQQKNQEYLNVVMDYFPDNLYEFIKSKKLTPLLVKLFVYQILRGINYLAGKSIAHRDIKPQNILVDEKTLRLVICDFGSAKQLVKEEPNLAYICSRCYRAPELIFGATDYTPQIDMWSVGCVIVQMVNGEAPFLGDSQLDQLLKIISVLGTPPKSDIRDMNPKYDLKDYKKMPNLKPSSWRSIFKTDDALFIDLVKKILQYSPLKRLSAVQAMMHPYFMELSSEETLLQLADEYSVPLHSLKLMLEMTEQQRLEVQKQNIAKNHQKIPECISEEGVSQQIISPSLTNTSLNSTGPTNAGLTNTNISNSHFIKKSRHKNTANYDFIPKQQQKLHNSEHVHFSTRVKTEADQSIKRIVRIRRNCPEFLQNSELNLSECRHAEQIQHKPRMTINESLPRTNHTYTSKYERYATDRQKTPGNV